MNLQRTLRIALVAEWLLIIAYVILFYKRTTWVTDVNVVFKLTTVPWLLASIISYIGLFFFKPWAKWTYLLLFAFNMVLDSFTGPLSEHRPDMAKVFGGFSSITTIVILYILLFTDVIPRKNSEEREAE